MSNITELKYVAILTHHMYITKFVSIGRMGTLFIKINYFISVKGLGLEIVSNSHTKGE